MATTAPSTRTTPASRRVASSSPIPQTSITRGATARSAVSPRVTTLNGTPARRGSIKASPPTHTSNSNGETRESLSANLKHETELKENLMVRIQEQEQAYKALTTQNDSLNSNLHSAETRIVEMYAEQSRWETEISQRMELAEKLRSQVRELEKEKRDIQRRYNEQTSTFEAERQSFYDNEQHLKSRIQSLTQSRKQHEPQSSPLNYESEAETEDEDARSVLQRPETPTQDLNDPDQEPAEMTSLRLELSTLSTSYTSLQSTLVLLQTQLVDLKRVNNELQEENESFMILLREKTLSGQYDVMKQVGAGGSSDEEDEEEADVGSLRNGSSGRNTLDKVEEEAPEETLEHQLERALDTESLSSRGGKRSQTRHRPESPTDEPRGESLADLPITGPGLDLAAELGRAENKDILEGNIIDDRDRSVLNGRIGRLRKDTRGQKISSSDSGAVEPPSDIDALRSEVKALKDANKALSLYASKIIDRIISEEGFEHVLAVDYEKEPPTPSTATPTSKPRPQSLLVGKSTGTMHKSSSSHSASTTPKLNVPSSKTQRRSLSFDWKGFSIFSAPEKKVDPNLRPLTLKPGASPVTGGRKLDNQEDEEDRRERERLNATMKLMGIQPAPPSPSIVQKSASSPGPGSAVNRRFSFFGSRTPGENSDTSSVRSAQSLPGGAHVGLGITSDLTQEALEHAEAENTLAALDAHERSLSAELAKGQGSGFTDIVPRSGRRSRRSAGGSGHSGSTVWSAGLSGTGDDE